MLDDHRDSTQPQQAFVAVFDVLGFKQRLQEQGLDLILSGYRQLRQTKLQCGTIPVLSPGGGAHHRIGSTIASDTILFWCSDDWAAVQTLISASACLIAATMDMGWPLRGALAYGRCVLDRETRDILGAADSGCVAERKEPSVDRRRSASIGIGAPDFWNAHPLT
jgi:hypothetical protein